MVWNMQKTTHRYVIAILASVLLLVYLASWVIMPRVGKALEVSFDDGCYTGNIAWFNAQGSTCTSGGPYLFGFPFVMHANGTQAELVVTVVLDVMPAALLATVLLFAVVPKTKE